MTRRFPVLILSTLGALLLAFSAPSAEAGERLAPDLSRQLVKQWGEHLVEVGFWLRKHDGREPHGKFNTPWTEERPHVSPGLAVDSKTVWMPDLNMDLDHVREIVVGPDDIKARIEGYFLGAPGWLLKLEEPLAGIKPISFVEPDQVGSVQNLLGIGMSYQRLGWSHVVSRTDWRYYVKDDKVWADFAAGYLLVTADGRPAGYTFSGTIPFHGEDSFLWRGVDIVASPILTLEHYARTAKKLEDRSIDLMPTVEISIKQEASEDRDPFSFMRRTMQSTSTGIQASALAVSPRLLIVHHFVDRETAGSLGSIRVQLADGEREAHFVGALKDYGVFIVEIEGEDLPAHVDLSPPGGFALNTPVLELSTSYATGTRRTSVEFNRVKAVTVAYKGALEPVLERFQKKGSMLYSAVDQALLGAVLEVRRRSLRDDGWNISGSDLRIVTCAEIAGILDDFESKFDPRIRVDEKAAKDVVWLGVEYQGLDRELAKANGVEVPTRGGQLGLLVNKIYPGSPAAAHGIQVGDILISVKQDGQPELTELASDNEDMATSPWDQIDFADIPEEYVAEYMAQMPPPWRGVRNDLNSRLTRLGADASVELVYYRGSERQAVDLKLSLSPTDYTNAPKQEIADFGLTIKDMTYEVRDHFRVEDDAPGVVVAKVVSGKRAAVAKIWPYELITQVNSRPVHSAKEFIDMIQKLREDPDTTGEPIELRVERFGKSRLIRLPL